MSGVTNKICTRCQISKPLEAFYNTSRYFKNPRINKLRKDTICKQCHYERTRVYRQTHKTEMAAAGRAWTLRNPERRKSIRKKYNASPKGIYRHLIKRGKNKVLISQQDFIDWYNSQRKYCSYCGIPESLVSKFAKGKLKARLTIDRIEPKGLYEKKNIILACGTCNFIKSDVLTMGEMFLVGKIIKKKWKKIL